MDSHETFTRKKIYRMAHFMDLEGAERVQEMLEKAEQEYILLKLKTIRDYSIEIDNQYKKKLYLVSTTISRQKSKMFLEMKISLQREKRNQVDSILQDVIDVVTVQLRSEKFYVAVLEKLFLQAFYRLMANDIIVRVREEDKKYIPAVIESTTPILEDTFKFNIVVTLDTDTLPHSSLGGIEIYSQSRRLKVINTVATRIASVFFKGMPIIRGMLLSGFDSNFIPRKEDFSPSFALLNVN